jgi:hypothetical protein
MKRFGMVSVLIASVGWGTPALANVWWLAVAASESAAGGTSAASGSTDTSDEQQDPELSLEFFDYLGTLVQRDGEWIDPLNLEQELAKEASSDGAKTKVSEVEQ